MPCDHWTSLPPDAGFCALKLYGGRPSVGVCGLCPQNTTKGRWPFTPPRPPVEVKFLEVTPPGPWPWWARALGLCRGGWDWLECRPLRERGVGDTFARVLGPLGEGYKKVRELLGYPCLCNSRQNRWNGSYRY